MKRCLMLSSKSEWIEAPNSGHYIHLTDSEIMTEAIDKCLSNEGEVYETEC